MFEAIASKIKLAFKYWGSYQILSLCQHWIANYNEILKPGKKENLSKLSVNKISRENKMNVSKGFKTVSEKKYNFFPLNLVLNSIHILICNLDLLVFNSLYNRFSINKLFSTPL